MVDYSTTMVPGGSSETVTYEALILGLADIPKQMRSLGDRFFECDFVLFHDNNPIVAGHVKLRGGGEN